MLVARTKPSNMSAIESTGYLCTALEEEGEGGRSLFLRIQFDKRLPVLDRLRWPTAGAGQAEERKGED